MKFLTFAVLVVLTCARNAPHHAYAEHNLMCNVCKKSVSHILSHVSSHQDLNANLLTDIVKFSEDSILGFCQDGGEEADCAGACRMMISELKSGEFATFKSSNSSEVCQHNHWCHTEETLSQLKSLPAQKNELISYVNRVQTDWVADNYPRWNKTSRHEYRRFLGTIVDPELRCNLKNVDNTDYDMSEMPESFDSEENWPNCKEIIGDIRDQSNCGCCWAFGAASAASDRMCIQTNGALKFPLSAQATCFCAEYGGCNGGQLYTPWSWFRSSGVVSGGQYNGTGPFGSGMCSDFTLPHCHHHGPQGDDPYPAEGEPGCPSQRSPMCPRHCDNTANDDHKNYSADEMTYRGSVKSFTTESAIMKTLMEDGPCETAFSVYEDFANYVSGVYKHTTGGYEGGHAVRIVGWGVDNGVKYWKVANSWNPYWGEKGYFRIARGHNECGIEQQAMASSSGATWSHKNDIVLN